VSFKYSEYLPGLDTVQILWRWAIRVQLIKLWKQETRANTRLYCHLYMNMILKKYVLKTFTQHFILIAFSSCLPFKCNHATAYNIISRHTLKYVRCTLCIPRVRSKYASISRCTLCYAQKPNYSFQNLSAYASV